MKARRFAKSSPGGTCKFIPEIGFLAGPEAAFGHSFPPLKRISKGILQERNA
jgi:hypothetical protein